jgi:hypothetical protein
MIKDLKEQGVAVLVMVGIAILSVVGMIVLSILQTAVAPTIGGNLGGLAGRNHSVYGLAVNSTITLFISAFALTGTFAAVIMLIIIVKALIGVVGSLQSKNE